MGNFRNYCNFARWTLLDDGDKPLPVELCISFCELKLCVDFGCRRFALWRVVYFDQSSRDRCNIAGPFTYCERLTLAQITTGLRSVLNSAAVYATLQNLLGAAKTRREFVSDFVRPSEGDYVLDIGCGTAEIIDFLPSVNYWGFDISSDYIQRAREKYTERTHFAHKYVTQVDVKTLPKFDLALAIGVLHHLDDDEAQEIFSLVRSTLKPGGRFITLDPCFESGQSRIAEFLIRRDRGQNVRTRARYVGLVPADWQFVRSEVRHKAWIPYTHCYLECQP